MQAGELDESTDEYGVTIGASLAKMYLEEASVPVGLIAYGDKRYFLEAETGAGQFNRILDYLAMSKTDGGTPLEAVLATEEPLWDNRSALIVVTPVAPGRSGTIALRELASRGVRVGVALMNAQSFGGVLRHVGQHGASRQVGHPGVRDKRGRRSCSRPQVVAAVSKPRRAMPRTR